MPWYILNCCSHRTGSRASTADLHPGVSACSLAYSRERCSPDDRQGGGSWCKFLSVSATWAVRFLVNLMYPVLLRAHYRYRTGTLIIITRTPYRYYDTALHSRRAELLEGCAFILLSCDLLLTNFVQFNQGSWTKRSECPQFRGTRALRYSSQTSNGPYQSTYHILFSHASSLMSVRSGI